MGMVWFLSTVLSISVGLAMESQTVLTEIQNRYEKTQDLEASFVQEYIGKVMRQPQQSEGKVYFKKRGMMRWDYKVPDQKLISDGRTLWLYQPEEKQVFVYPAEEMIKEFGFLAGVGDLRRDFKLLNPQELAPQKEGTYVVELMPRENHPAVSKLSFRVDPKTYYIVQVDVIDGLGNVTRTRLMEIRTNQGLPDSFFQFKIPPGVEVIKTPSSSSPGGKGVPKK
jgi:outer membrane lipoprotein carrier protein